MTKTHEDNTAPTPEELQSHFTSYDNVELLAMGGMGAVYKARQISLDRPVAIKVLTHACSSSLQFRQIFKSEAQVMAKLNHPNLASIYDHGEVNGMLYIVMQFVEGRSLHQAAHGKPVTQNEAASMISNISKALSHAHDVGILHRDIKPANIIINSDIIPVVVDFGLAHHSQESTMKGETVFGTPGYTAPEVLTPPFKADQRADVFSLGVLFYELLTGQLPQQPYVQPSRLAPVDARYDSIVMRAMHPTPALRYSSTKALATDLDKVIAGKQLATSPLLLTPTAHPELATASTPIAAVSPPLARTPLTALSGKRPMRSSPLPSLSNRSGVNKQSMAVVLAACITLALAIITIVISSVKQDSQPPVASGGLPAPAAASSSTSSR